MLPPRILLLFFLLCLTCYPHQDLVAPCLEKKMTNLAKLDFVALDITWKNYLTWLVDTNIHLEAGNLGETIKEGNSASSQDQVKAMIFICRHLDERLKRNGNGHWVRTCRTPKHLVDLYQASLKEKGVKTNFLDQAKPMDIPDLVFDLLGQLNTALLDLADFIVERGNEVYQSD
ncbi:unnamed protein product [Malus baccata var. baccata]